jgi:hypothetical protein
MRYHTRHGAIINVRCKELAEFLRKRIDGMPRVPPLQMLIDFGDPFMFWWYDEDGQLHPNDTDYPPEIDEDYEPYLDDIPF